ncbi:MAG: VanZ family protein [Crocosphaera sp.]|nr:VanZ family protein [Crocosphaera sp.]
MVRHNSKPNYQPPSPQKAIAIILWGLGLILLATLLPFNFSLPSETSWTSIIEQFATNKTSKQDLISNLLLFLPLGVGLTVYMYSTPLKRWLCFLLIAIISLFVSGSVELLQIFIPSRASTFSDIVLNILGGCLGFLLFELWVQQQSKIKQLQWPRVLSNHSVFFKFLALIGYGSTVILLLLIAKNLTQLSNWNTEFLLTLGNELTGDRPWSGKISHVCWSDQAIPPTQVSQLLSGTCPHTDGMFTVSYPLVGDNPYIEQHQQLPPLVPQRQKPSPITSDGVHLNPQYWLTTVAPVNTLNQAIRKTSQFTLRATIATDNLQQIGPARIITLSSDPFHRNFTLAQQGSDLSIRVRSPLSGDNATQLQFLISDIFTDRKSHNFVITYDQYILRVYIDEIQQFSETSITPDAAIFWRILSPIMGGRVTLKPIHQLFYILLHRSLIFIPLGYFLSVVVTSNFVGYKIRWFLLGLVSIMLAWCLEIWIIDINGSRFQTFTILINLFLILFPSFYRKLHHYSQ